jgi:selenocysteine-specific elongation factor
MPQTREHLEICTLLGVKYGLVVLTKTDLVDQEWLELVVEDIRDFVRGTFLEDTPIIPVSAVTGEGIPEFMDALDKLSALIPDRLPTSLFRLPVDRVFTMKGFGTVITGTLISGRVRVGDPVMIYPSRVTSKVRGIQVHNQSVNEAEAGMRTAINFQGLEKASVSRGEVVSSPGALIPTYMLDVSTHFLASNKKPIKNRARIRLHAGTNEVLGNLILLDREELFPGETAVAQIRFDSPVALVKDDRFVLRSYSPLRTIGGGHVLNPIPQKHKRFRSEVIDGVKGIIDHTPEEIVLYHLNESGYTGLSSSELKIMTNIPEKQIQNMMQVLLSKRTVILLDRENQIYIHQNSFEKLKQETVQNLNHYHKTNPLKTGMPKEELKSKFSPFLNPKLFNLVLGQMIKDNEIVQDEVTVRLATHAVALGIDQKQIKKEIVDAYKKNGLTPPYFKELSKNLGIDSRTAKDVLMYLVDEGLIIKVKEDLYFLAEAVKDLQNRLIDFLGVHGEITTPQFKDMAGVSRKYLIPLIEYFDSNNVTIRIGDIRKLRMKPGNAGIK